MSKGRRKEEEAPPISELLPGEQVRLGVVIQALAKIHESDEYQQKMYAPSETGTGKKFDIQRYWLFEFGGNILEREGIAYSFSSYVPENTVTIDMHPVTDAKANQMAGTSLQIHDAKYVDGYVQVGNYGVTAYYKPAEVLMVLEDMVTAFSDITGVEVTRPSKPT